jgi:imidazolonepropionase-like amidohydrolase
VLSHWLNNNLADCQQTIAQLANASDSLIVLVTDAPQLSPAKAYHREIRLASEAGLTPEQIIQAGTRNAAVHPGRENEIGTLEAGKLADIIIVEGNPLEDLTALHNIEVVIKDGEMVVDNRSIY